MPDIHDIWGVMYKPGGGGGRGEDEDESGERKWRKKERNKSPKNLQKPRADFAIFSPKIRAVFLACSDEVVILKV
jgi:hypothetical protein